MNSQAYKEVESNKPLKLSDLLQPVLGHFVRVEEGKHSPIYILQTSAGEEVGIYGSTDLNRKMKKVPIGARVAIGLKKQIVLEESNQIFMEAYVALISEPIPLG